VPFPTSGDVTLGTISPDGKYVACVHDAGGLTRLTVSQRVPGSAEVLIAPSAPVSYWGTAYSPDGNYLYSTIASRVDRSGGVLFRQPALGGPRQKLADHVDAIAAPDPSGKRVVFKRNNAADNHTGLIMMDAAGGPETILATSDGGFAFDSYAWRPDGRAVVYASGSTLESPDWALYEVAPGLRKPELLLGMRQGPIHGINMPDDKGIFAIAPDPDTGIDQIWSIAFSNGRRYRITRDSNAYTALSITADGSTILSPLQAIESDLWLASLDDPSAAPRKLTNGLGGVGGAAFLRAGNILYAMRGASGADLWMLTPPGGESRQVTFTGDIHDSVAVSRDGRLAVYVGGARGASILRVLDLQSGQSRDLVSGQKPGAAAFSNDGLWLIVNSRVGANWEIWKVPVTGGPAVKLADAEETQPAISPDDKTLAFTNADPATGDLFVVLLPLAGGEPRRFKLPRRIGQLQWANGEWLFYSIASGPDRGLWKLPVDGGPHKLVRRIDQDRMWSYTISADGKQAVCSAGRTYVILVQITNFR
jgi:Tol biopolymer transport system component